MTTLPRLWSILAFEATGVKQVHVPVMTDKVIHFLQPRPGGLYIDCTVGAAGHSRAILEAAGGQARLVGIDQDPDALALAKENLRHFGEAVTLVHENFRHLPQIMHRLGLTGADGILLDLGMSSLQVDKPERGFTYHEEAPLDMRMNPEQATTAADLVNNLDEDSLAKILWEWGEERWSRRIAAAIVRRRRSRPITTTLELVEVIKSAIPAPARRTGGHPARRTFQALRIAVNDELGAIKDVLEPAAELLRPGGRLVVISFHSLEDRLVKHTFRRLSTDCTCTSRAECRCGNRRLLNILTRRPVQPDPAEIALNPRARSAKLRAAERIGTYRAKEENKRW